MNNVDITNSKLDFQPEDNYKKLSLHSWFPTVIGVVDCPFYDEVKETFCGVYDIKDDVDRGMIWTPLHNEKDVWVIEKFNKWVTKNVNEYAKFHKHVTPFECTESWIIDYQSNTHNPWHKHNGSVYSTVFFLLSDPKDSPTSFRSPEYGDMKNASGVTSDVAGETRFYNTVSAPTCNYAPIPGRLLIFRSHTEHMADLKTTKKRVIISQNFDKKHVESRMELLNNEY